MSVRKLKTQSNMEREAAWFRDRGVTVDKLRLVVQFAEFHRKARFDFDPKATANFLFWARGCAGLAKTFPEWTYTEEGNKPRIVSPDGTHAISFSHGTDATGDLQRIPTTWNSTGPATEEFVACNTGYLFPIPDESDVEIDHAKCLNYLLLAAPFKDEVRYELSLPMKTEAGKIVEWGPRLFPGTVKTGMVIPAAPAGAEPETNIDVEPKG